MNFPSQGLLPAECRRAPETRRARKLYVPSMDEKKRGKWVVVFERKDEEGEPDIGSTPHIIPTLGKHHQIDDSCWCLPQRAPREEGVDAFLHHLSH